MYNLLPSQTNNTNGCATLKFSTHQSYTNFNIDKDGKEDIYERRNPIKIVSYRTTAHVFGLEVSRKLFYIVL